MLQTEPASAQDHFGLNGLSPNPDSNTKVPAGTFRQDPPWVIGVSHFDVQGDTWTRQTILETEAAAQTEPRIKEIIVLDAALDASKQAEDVARLIELGVDALILSPVPNASSDDAVASAAAAGIPVILHTGTVGTDSFATEIQGGGVHFGQVLGEWLVDAIGNSGRIWVLRGPEGHPEVDLRYQGLVAALAGKDVEIAAEAFADWDYASARAICEAFLSAAPDVDGIWSSGANMTSACTDVFLEAGVEVPPITGEVSNGFFGQWIEDGLTSVAAEYSPQQGSAALAAAIALLQGEEIFQSYVYSPAPWTLEKAIQYYRPDLSGDLWWPSALSEDILRRTYGK